MFIAEKMAVYAHMKTIQVNQRGKMKFFDLANGAVFMCSGNEFIKVGSMTAVSISPRVVRFAPDDQVMPSKQESTTIPNWKCASVRMSINNCGK